MHQLLKETAVKFPPSPSRPWHLIFNSDEIVPGNVLSSDTSRKLQMRYVSFAEFGAVNLAKEHAWFVVFATRSNVAQSVVECFLLLVMKLKHDFLKKDSKHSSSKLLVMLCQFTCTSLHIADCILKIQMYLYTSCLLFMVV